MTSDDSPVGALEAGQAFGELDRLMLGEQSVESVLQEVAELAKVAVPGASEVSVSLVTGGRAVTAAFTGPLAVELDERQYERRYGPCLEAALTGQAILVEDAATETRWGDYTEAASKRGALSSLSTPIGLAQQSPAALNIYSTRPHAFDEHSQQLAATFASYAAVALARGRAGSSAGAWHPQMPTSGARSVEPARPASAFAPRLGSIAAGTAALEVDLLSGSAVMWLSGEFDVATAGVLGNVLQVLLVAPPASKRRLVIDVGAVSFIDCAGLGPLLHAAHGAPGRRVDLVLQGDSPALSRLVAAMDRAGLPLPPLLAPDG